MREQSFRIYRPLHVLIFGALLLAAGCGSDDSGTSTYELAGVVEDIASGDPVGGARVTFTSDTLYRAEASTDDEGYYEMSVVTDVPFGQVRAEKDGFLMDEKSVFFDSASRRIDLGLRRAEGP